MFGVSCHSTWLRGQVHYIRIPLFLPVMMGTNGGGEGGETLNKQLAASGQLEALSTITPGNNTDASASHLFSWRG